MRYFNIINIVCKASLVVGVALASLACQKEHGAEENLAGNQISFNVGVEKTRVATSVVSGGDMADFGVYSSFTSRGGADLFSNTKVTCKTTDGVTTTSYNNDNALYYNSYEEIEFFAYSPYNSSAVFTPADNTTDPATNAKLSITDYSINPATEQDSDPKELLVAYTKQEMIDNNVDLGFNHTLCALQFKAKGDEFVKIVSLDLSYVNTKGDMVYDFNTNAATWSNLSGADATKIPIGILADKPLTPDSYTTVSNGYTIMIPQETLPARSCLHIVIREDDAPIDGSADITLDMPLFMHKWVAQKLHTYSLEIDHYSIKNFEVTLSDWEDGGSLYYDFDDGVNPEITPANWIVFDECADQEEFNSEVLDAINAGNELVILGDYKKGAIEHLGTFYNDEPGNQFISHAGVNLGHDINKEQSIDFRYFKNLEKVPDYTFYLNNYITKLLFNEDVTEIGKEVFSGCYSLSFLELPSVETLGNSAFNGCKNLSFLTLSNNLTVVSDGAFYDCSSLTFEGIDFSNVKTIENTAFFGCAALSSIDLPAVTTIGNNVFGGCKLLTSIDLPQLTTLGAQVFDNSSLSTICLPKVTEVEAKAFCGLADGANIYLTSEENITLYFSPESDNWNNINLYIHTDKVLKLNKENKNDVTFKIFDASTKKIIKYGLNAKAVFKSVNFIDDNGEITHILEMNDKGLYVKVEVVN